jgi:hypothetical protein
MVSYELSPDTPVLSALSRQTLAAARAAGSDDLAAAGRRHAAAKAVAALADKLGGLVGALHLFKYRGVRPFLVLSDNRSVGLTNAEKARRQSGSCARAYTG